MRTFNDYEKEIIEKIIFEHAKPGAPCFASNIVQSEFVGFIYVDITDSKQARLFIQKTAFNALSKNNPCWYPNFQKRIHTRIAQLVDLLEYLSMAKFIDLTAQTPGILFVGNRTDNEDYIEFSIDSPSLLNRFAEICNKTIVPLSSFWELYKNGCKSFEESKFEKENRSRNIALWVTTISLLSSILFSVWREWKGSQPSKSPTRIEVASPIVLQNDRIDSLIIAIKDAVKVINSTAISAKK
jgi:hypothetical protein